MSSKDHLSSFVVFLLGAVGLLMLLISSGCDSSEVGRMPEVERALPITPQLQPTEKTARQESSGGGVTLSEDARIVPGPPGNIRLSSKNGRTMIEWQGTRDDRVTEYAIYRAREGEATWQLAGRVPASEGNTGLHSFSEPAKAGFRYAISAIDVRGTEGPKQVAGSGN